MQPTWVFEQISWMHRERGRPGTIGCGWAGCEHAGHAAAVLLSGTSSKCTIPQRNRKWAESPNLAESPKSVGVPWMCRLLGLSDTCQWSSRHVWTSLSNVLADGLEHGQQSAQTSQGSSGAASHKHRSDHEDFRSTGAALQMAVGKADWHPQSGVRRAVPALT